jgi:hypothetical protein
VPAPTPSPTPNPCPTPSGAPALKPPSQTVVRGKRVPGRLQLHA